MLVLVIIVSSDSNTKNHVGIQTNFSVWRLTSRGAIHCSPSIGDSVNLSIEPISSFTFVFLTHTHTQTRACEQTYTQAGARNHTHLLPLGRGGKKSDNQNGYCRWCKRVFAKQFPRARSTLNLRPEVSLSKSTWRGWVTTESRMSFCLHSELV